MAINVNLAPFINKEFLVTGAWGEPRAGHIHAGIDLQTREAYQTGIGQPVYSMSRGEVIRVDQTDHTGYGGLCIIRDLDDNFMWLYGDLSDNTVLVSVGDIVQQGQQISFEGNPSGTASTGLHVHMEKEVNIDGQYHFGYENTINPVDGTGIENVVNYSNVYIYDGTPIPPGPTPSESNNVKKWHYQKSRKVNIRI